MTERKPKDTAEAREHGGSRPRQTTWGEWGVVRMKKGFTLIELLVVIAIIGILAGITFPVFARAKESAYRSSDMSNLNAIRTALQLYRADQGAYPPSLLGYATAYLGGVPTADTVIPAGSVVSALYPKRVDSVQTFRPAFVRPRQGSLEKEFATAVWPDGATTGGGDPNAYQRFGPDQVVQRAVIQGDGSCVATDNLYYRISGFDAAEVKTPTGNRNELRYTLFWSRYSVPVTPCDANTGGGSSSDDTRQLGYNDPPDTTVVTWDSYFRDYDANGSPTHTKKDIVLFLNGSARPYDSATIAAQSWRVTP